jgi:hypothetical protein
MSKWLIFASLLIQAHFAASCLVPLREEDKHAMGGTLRWAWPWANGDSGPLGTMVADGASPTTVILLGITSSTLLLLAAMSVAGWWVPVAWWRTLAAAGAVLLVAMLTLFFGPTKLIPLLFALSTIYISLMRSSSLALE